MNIFKLTLVSVFVFGASCGVAFSQTIAGAGSTSASESQSAAAAGAVGIAIGAPGGGGSVGAQGGIGSPGSISAFSPVGLGVGGSSGASANASPTIVVGSGNTYEAADLGDSVPTLFVPNLTTSNGTCMGSLSTGIAVSGFGGGFGKTYTSAECNARFNANQLNALGAPDLAMEVMCAVDAIYNADQRMKRPRCQPRDEAGTTDSTTMYQNTAPVGGGSGGAPMEAVDMKWFDKDPLTGSYSTIDTDTTDYVLREDGMLHYQDSGLPDRGER